MLRFRRRRAAPNLALALALGIASGSAVAGDDDPAWRRLTASWWQWALSIPAATNPVADSNGRYCMIGQRGPVWFLAGSVTGQPVVRTCNVPEGTPLFFPVVNSVNFNSPGCGQVDRNLGVAELRALVAPGIDAASGLKVLLNNRKVGGIRRIKAEPFNVSLPRRDLLSATFGIDCLVPGRIYSPAIDDGYYVLLRGLNPGQHHLSIQGSLPGFEVDVFYTLNVQATRLKDD